MATTKEVLAREAREAEEWAKQNARSMAENGARYRRMSSWEGSTWSKTVESLLLPVKDGGYGLYPLSPIFALLAPFVDITAETAYTDTRARVGVGLAFFYEWDDRLRAFALAHEALHVANRHFQRADEMGRTFEDAHRMLNLAGDMEINDLLRNMGVARSEDEDRFVFPEGMGYERSRTMEEYLVALSGDMEKLRELARQLAAAAGESGSSGGGCGGSSGESGSQGYESGSAPGSSSSSGDNEGGEDGDGKGDWTSQYVRANVGHACGSRSNSEDDREGERIEGETGVRGRAMADVEGARQDAEALVREAADGSNSMGSGAGDSWVRLLARMAPPRVNWQSVLAGVVGRSMSSRVRGNRYATYKRPNRRRQGGEFVWPSREDNKPTVHVAVDTSGSMGRDDYAHAVAEIEGILRASASGAAIGFYGVDTQMSERPRMVSHVRDLKAFGGGGTDMSVPYEWMAGEWAAGGKRRRELPDVHVLVTDGWVDWGETLRAAAACRQFTRMVIVVTAMGESRQVIDDGRAAGVSVVFVNGS